MILRYNLSLDPPNRLCKYSGIVKTCNRKKVSEKDKETTYGRPTHDMMMKRH